MMIQRCIGRHERSHFCLIILFAVVGEEEAKKDLKPGKWSGSRAAMLAEGIVVSRGSFVVGI